MKTSSKKIVWALIIGLLLAVSTIVLFSVSSGDDQLSVVGELSCDRKIVCASEETCALQCSDFEADGSFTCEVNEIDGPFSFDGEIYVACAREEEVERCITGFDGETYCYTTTETIDLPPYTIDFLFSSSNCNPLNYHLCWEYVAEFGSARSNPRLRALGIPSATIDGVTYFKDDFDWPYSCQGDHAYLYDKDTVPFCSVGGCSNAVAELPTTGSIHLDDYDPIKPKIVCHDYDSSGGSWVWSWATWYWNLDYVSTSFECDYDADCAASERCVFSPNGISSRCEALDCAFTDVVVDHKCVNAEIPAVCAQIGISDIFDCRDYVIEFVDILTEDVDGQIELINELTQERDEQLLIIQDLELTVAEYAVVIDDFELTVQEQASYIADLNLTVQEQESFINDLQLNIADQEALISELQGVVSDQVAIIEGLNLNVQEQASYIADLNLTVQEQVQIINGLEQNIEDKLELIGLLVAENDFQADLISQLNLSLQDQAGVIDSLNLELEDDAALISDLELSVEDQAEIIDFLTVTTQDKLELIEELELNLDEQGEIIGDLSLTIEEQEFIISGLTSNIDEQAEIISNMALNNAEQNALIDNLYSELSDQEDLISELERLESNRRLRNTLFVVGGFVFGGLLTFVMFRYVFNPKKSVKKKSRKGGKKR